MKKILSLAIFFLGSFGVAFAQVDIDTFNIRAFGSTDSSPPTTPTLLTANPVASTQIDLSWSSSTDNFSVGGYVLSRDGLVVATTSLLSYSDTGLIASTTYSYTVRSFDLSLNYSSSSNSLSTTTPDTPVPPVVVTDSEEGTASRVVVDRFLIQAGLSTSSLEVETAHLARLEIRWGRSDDYELGYVVGSVYKKEHTFLLTDLEPGTVYQYEIIGHAPHGRPVVLKEGSFTTKSENISFVPSNVSRFIASSNGDDVLLNWQLPFGDVSHVRIVRSHLGFPKYPSDGAVIYQGSGTEVQDVDILSKHSPVYYTAFVYDSLGNVSSGAVALVYAKEDGVGVSSYNDAGHKITEEPNVLIQQERISPQMRMPDLSDILLTQGIEASSFLDAPVSLEGFKPFTVSVPVDSIAGNLKSIIVTIIDPTDTRQVYSFLLRPNKDRSAYEANISPLLVHGHSQAILEIFDYEAYAVATYQAPILFSKKVEINNEVVFPDKLIEFKGPILLLPVLLVLSLLFILFVWKRRSEDNN